jgi:hypothetical protein
MIESRDHGGAAIFCEIYIFLLQSWVRIGQMNVFIKVKVKQSHHRPGQALRVPGV